MKLTEQTQQLFSFIADDIALLNTLHDREITGEMLILLKDNNFPRTLGFALQKQDSIEALDLLESGVKELKNNKETLDELAADYASIYLNYSLSASPFESVWIDEENLVMQSAMFDVREYYDRYSLKVEEWRLRSDDHFICQLQFIAYVLNLKEYKNLKELATFMDEHLFRWFDMFASKVVKRCATAFYAGLVGLTFSYISELRDLLAIILEEARPDKEQIEAKLTKSIPLKTAAQDYIPGTEESW